MASLVLDTKTCLPRVTRLRWESQPWRSIKEAVHTSEPADWDRLLAPFKHLRLTVPQRKVPLTAEQVKHLKGCYAFFQSGYIVTDQGGQRVALFHRQESNRLTDGVLVPRITKGCSVIRSKSPKQWPPQKDLLESVISIFGDKVQIPWTSFVPYAVAYVEMRQSKGDKPYTPAYFFLLNRATVPGRLAKCLSAATDGDSYVGMKDCGSLRQGRVRVDRKWVEIQGEIDRMVLDHLCRCPSTPAQGHSEGRGFRLLAPEEIQNLASHKRQFPERTQCLANLVSPMAVLGIATIMREFVDFPIWVQHDLLPWGNGIVKLVRNCFLPS